MTAIAISRICEPAITSFRPDGSLVDLAAPDELEIDFNEVAYGLAKLNRFTGTYPGIGFSVAQHSAMGAQALLNEGESEITAALFLLHDGHEYKLGDQSRPMTELVAATLEKQQPGLGRIYLQTLSSIKKSWDVAIFSAAGLPDPSRWTNRQRHAVETMDMRMMAAEAEALFGRTARARYPLKAYPKPMTHGKIAALGAMKAEELFLKLFDRLIGHERRFALAIRHDIYRTANT